MRKLRYDVFTKSIYKLFIYVYNKYKSRNRFVFLILERVDFMSVHFSAKRFTRLKTNNIKEKIWKDSVELFKKFEYLGKQSTKAARNVKKHLKELHKLYNYNEKKVNKNKLTKKDCEKERVLVDKIEGYISDLNKFIKEREENIKLLDYALLIIDHDIFTGKFKFDRNFIHTIELDTPREE